MFTTRALRGHAGSWDLRKTAAGLRDRLSAVGQAAGPVGRLFTRSLVEGLVLPVRAVAVSVEKGGISVVAGSRFLSRIRVRKPLTYSLEQTDPGSVASAVSVGLKQVSAKRVTLVVPSEWTVARVVALPLAARDNLADVVGYELDRLTPFSAEAAYYDFTVIGEDGTLTLLVVAARGDLVDGYIGALASKGISVERLAVGASGLATLAAYGRSAICLEVGPGAFQGALTASGALASAFRGALPEDKQSRIEKMASALSPVVEAARRQGKEPAVLAAGDAEGLERLIGIPVRRLEDEPRIGKLGPSCTAAGVLLESLWPGARGLDLLKKGRHGQLKAPKAMTMLLCSLLLAVWLPYSLMPLRHEQKRLAEIERQISSRKEDVRKVERLKKEVKGLTEEIALIDRFKHERPMTLSVLKELTDLLPKTAWTTRIRMTETTADIEGYAKSASGLLPLIERSRYLKKAEFSSPIIRDVKMDKDRFAIKLKIEEAKDEKK